MIQPITLQNPLINLNFTEVPQIITLTHQLSPKPHLKKPIISSKWGKKRSGSLSSRNNKILFNAIVTVASNLKILPEPFDSLVREFWIVSGGGNGGKVWFRNGFGGGGNGGKGNKRNKLGFWVVLVVSIGLGIWGFLERGKGIDLSSGGILVILCGLIVGYCLWKKDLRNWVLGFFCGVVFMGLGFRNNVDLIKLVDVFKVNSCSIGVDLKKKKKRYKKWT